MSECEFEIVFARDKGFQTISLPAPPELKPDEVLVRPEYVGICGSDLYLMEAQDGDLRLGHEWVGRVERIGERAAGFRPGDVVTSTGTFACFSCTYCKAEQTHFCDHAEYLSSDRIGALRSWMVVQQGNLVKIPGTLSQAHVIHEVLAVAEEGMRLAREQFETLPTEMGILGGGPIGTMLALVARRSGVRPTVIEKRSHRCEAVRSLGMECIALGQALLDPRYLARFSLIADATSDSGGDSGGFRNLASFARKGFVGLMIGKYVRPQEIPRVFNRLGGKLVWMRGMPQTTLVESVAKWNSSIEELASGYVSEVIPVNRVDQAFARAASKSSPMKVVIQLFPGGSS